MGKLGSVVVCTLALSLGVFGASPAWAVALGGIHVHSKLSQHFRADVPITGISRSQLANVNVQVAPPSDFRKLGIDRDRILDDFRFRKITEGGKSYIEITSTQPVEEPVVSFLLQVDTPSGQLVRQYTVLLNPPGGEGGVNVPAANASQPAAPPAHPNASAQQASPRTSSASAPSAGAQSSGDTPAKPAQSAQPAAASTPARPARPHHAAAHHAAAKHHHVRYYGPVHRHQTLWSIAAAVRPHSSGITMDQMMMALYKANPHAFDGSINYLQAGSRLRVPSVQAIRAINAAHAHKEANAQISAYKTQQEEQAAALKGELRLMAPVSGTANAFQVANTPGAGTPKTSSTTGKPQQSAAKAANGSQAAAPATQKPADKPKESQAKPAAGASPEAAHSQSGSTSPSGQAATQSGATVGTAAASGKQAAGKQAQPEASNSSKPAATTTQPARQPAPHPQSKQAPAQGGKPEKTAAPAHKAHGRKAATAGRAGGLAGYGRPLLLGVLLLLLMLFGLRVWRRRKSSRVVDIGELETAYPSADAPTEPAVENSQATTEPEPVDEPSTDVPEDDDIAAALSDADFHISYGLYDDAAQILREVTNKAPQRLDIKIKLLEAYHGARQAEPFAVLARRVHESLDESDPRWERVAVLGADLAPNDPLFAAETPADNTTEQAQDVDPGLEMSEYEHAFDAPRSDGTPEPGEESPTPDAEIIPEDDDSSVGEPDEGGTYDLNADPDTLSDEYEPEGGAEIDESAGGAPHTAETGSEEPSKEALEFDAGMPAAPDELAEAEPENEDWRDAPLEFDLGSHDEDFSALSGQEETEESADAGPAEESAPQQGEEQAGVPEGAESEPGNEFAEDPLSDFDLDKFLEESQYNTPGAQEADQQPPMEGEDETAFGVPAPDHGSSDLDTLETSSDESPDADMELDDLLGGDEDDDMTTKLDLARTYLEMGDSEMASSLLDAVAEKGSEVQRKEAQALRERFE